MNKSTLALLLVVLAVVSALSSLVIGSYFPHKPLVWQVLAGISVVTFIAYVVVKFADISNTFSKRTARYGLNSGVMAIAAIFIAVIVNMIAVEHDWKVDFTKNKLHSLSEQSRKVVGSLDVTVTIRPLVYPNQRRGYDKVFDRYLDISDKIKIEYIDPDKDLMLAKQYKISKPHTIIIESPARSTKIDNLRGGADDPNIEEKLTNGIIQVAKGAKRKIYFITGHGEKQIGDRGPKGLSQVKEKLELGRYDVKTLLLIDQKAIPKDADILVLAGPTKWFMKHEVTMLEKYIKAGGAVLFLMDPKSSPNLKPLLTKFGADWKKDKIIVEASPLAKFMGGPLAPIVTSFERGHKITQDLSGGKNSLSVFRLASPVEKTAKAPAGYTVKKLFSSRQDSSYQVSYPKSGKLTLDPNKYEKKGPLNLALAITGAMEGAKEKKDVKKDDKKDDKKEEKKKEPEFRLVVVGDSDFSSNNFVQIGINRDLFQNMLSWLAQEEDLIAIRPKDSNQSKFDITQARALTIFWASVGFLPLSMFFAGFFVWFRRRKK